MQIQHGRPGPSDGQRKSVAIAAAASFNGHILNLNAPLPLVGLKSADVAALLPELKAQRGVIFLIGRGIHTVMKPCKRALVMKNRSLGTVKPGNITGQDIAGIGKGPAGKAASFVSF